MLNKDKPGPEATAEGWLHRVHEVVMKDPIQNYNWGPEAFRAPDESNVPTKEDMAVNGLIKNTGRHLCPHCGYEASPDFGAPCVMCGMSLKEVEVGPKEANKKSEEWKAKMEEDDRLEQIEEEWKEERRVRAMQELQERRGMATTLVDSQ